MTDPNWQELKPHFWRNAREFSTALCAVALAGCVVAAALSFSASLFGWVGFVVASLVAVAALVALAAWDSAKTDARLERQLAESERLRRGPV